MEGGVNGEPTDRVLRLMMKTTEEGVRPPARGFRVSPATSIRKLNHCFTTA
jgi:hypothetical protein